MIYIDFAVYSPPNGQPRCYATYVYIVTRIRNFLFWENWISQIDAIGKGGYNVYYILMELGK